MPTRVFTFAHSCVDQRPERGRVTECDASILELGVQSDGGAVVSVAIAQREMVTALPDLVRCGGECAWIECAHVHRRVCELTLCVDEALVDEALDAGALACEEYLVQLAMVVWQAARIPAAPRGADADDAGGGGLGPCAAWEPSLPLYEHQERTVAWMIAHEARLPLPLRYDGNLRLTARYYIDTEGMAVTTDPSERTAQLAGGICADGLGRGKTATALRLVADETPPPPPCAATPYETGASLVILPLNLVSQWASEARKFLPGQTGVLWLVEARDLRAATMQSLLGAHVVFTTFELLRSNPAYAALVDEALGGRPKERAALAAWARRPGQTAAVLEAVTWRRLVVDEIHQATDSVRDARQLRLFRYRALWGLSATPALEGEAAQQLYLLLAREKVHHPNLLAAVVRGAVRRGADDAGVGTTHEVALVTLTAEERVRARDTLDRPLAEQVRSTMSHAAGDEAGRARVAQLRAKEAAHERSVRILERAARELDGECEEIAARCVEGDEAARTLAALEAEAAREACEVHARDVQRARSQLATVRARRIRWEERASEQQRRIAELASSRKCVACHGADAALIGAQCLHLVCRGCALDDGRGGGAPQCPVCGADAPQALVAIPERGGEGSKIKSIADHLLGVPPDEPVVLFVQWRTMIRPVRDGLQAHGLAVALLAGNGHARATTLAALGSGGVLLLCLEDSFAGLHLPHAAHVVFAHALVADRARVEHLERQAIARCARPGQTRRVQVVSFVCEATGEFQIYRNTH